MATRTPGTVVISSARQDWVADKELELSHQIWVYSQGSLFVVT